MVSNTVVSWWWWVISLPALLLLQFCWGFFLLFLFLCELKRWSYSVCLFTLPTLGGSPTTNWPILKSSTSFAATREPWADTKFFGTIHTSARFTSNGYSLPPIPFLVIFSPNITLNCTPNITLSHVLHVSAFSVDLLSISAITNSLNCKVEFFPFIVPFKIHESGRGLGLVDCKMAYMVWIVTHVLVQIKVF